MRKVSKFLYIALLITALIGLSLLDSLGQEYKGGMLQGAIRLKLKPTIISAVYVTKNSNGVLTSGIQELDKLNKSYSAAEMSRIFPYSPRSESKLIKHGLNLWYEVKISAKADIATVLSDYKNLSSVQVAEPIYEKKLIGAGISGKVNLADIKETDEPFNDPYLPRQWHYNNTGQTGYVAGADINLYEAWKITTGSPNVIVSIHDQGVEYDHEDLAASMWVNEAELNGTSGVDDDGNGYKDDIYGFNFADNVGAISPGDHGTHVAGTIAAVNNNGKGVAGIAGGDGTSQGVKIMSCQILGGVSTGNLPNSYVYAADNGAVISQNSWGYTSAEVYEQTVLDAIDYFIEEAGDYDGSPMSGGVVIFAAGNDDDNGDWYPGCYKNVITVSALDASNYKASYSNYGTWVDISAPGGDSEDDYGSYYSNGVLSTETGNSYGYMDGTSMACPHVSGIAALVVSKFGSSSFTSEALKTHLLTGVNDLDGISGNATYIGKLGSGRIDAVLTLKENEGVAPDKIVNLTLKGISQDFASLAWTVPTDEDDGIPSSFQILYSKEVINASTLDIAKSKTFKIEGGVGDTVSFDVEGLDALTEYHFAVRSIDRWGNVSDFSNQLVATTNSGPDAWVDKSKFAYELQYAGYDPVTYESYYDTLYYLPVDVNTQTSVNGANSFYLHNTGEGLLNWNAEKRHISTSTYYSKAYVRFPKLAGALNNQKANINSLVVPKGNIQVLSQESTYEDMSYFDYSSNFYYIGETDLALSNSAATRFYVSSSDGFNLTNVEAMLNYESSEDSPLILEVYRGADIADAKLIYQHEITDCTVGWNYFGLEEQIYFEQGTYFWLVTHVPAGTLYPLGAGVETSSDYSNNCYLSFNFGKSWSRFEDVYSNNLLVWAIMPVSHYKTPGEYYTVAPSSGLVNTNDSIEVTASIDASKLINGTYKSNIVLNTNETSEPMIRVPVTFEISGQKAIINGDKLIDIGSTMLGTEKVVSITLENVGYGKFKYPSISFSNSEFSLVNYLNTISPQSEYTFQVKYTPEKAGNSNAKVRIYNDYGDEYAFNITAVCSEPPVMSILPDSIYIDNIAIKDTVNGMFFLKNTGNYPLSYYFPSFADGSNVTTTTTNCNFGYSAKNNSGGVLSTPEFKWYDISNTGTPITDYSRDERYWFYPVELGFEFPFFGKVETQVYITNYGLVSFDENSVFNNSPLQFKQEDSPDRFITALGADFDLTNGGAIYYQDFGDMFVVQYNNVVYPTYDWDTDEVVNLKLSFEIVLHNDGNISIYYKDLSSADLYFAYIGIEDQNQSDGLLVSDYNNQNLTLANNTAVEFVNPGLGLVYELSNPEGIIMVGDSVQVDFKAKTDILNMGMHVENIPVLSNDPYNNPGILSIYMNVTAGGVSELVALDTLIDFGNVFQTDVVTQNLWLVNKGKANDTIVSANLKHGFFDFSVSVPVVLSPNRKQLFEITAPSSILGSYSDTLEFVSKSGTVIEVGLVANVIEAPQIDINLLSITDTIEAGTPKNYLLTVTNNGGNNLEVAPVSGSWISVAKKDSKSTEVPEYTYYWNSNDETNGPVYSWNEIVSKGTKVNVSPWGIDDTPFFSESVDLPFTFNFYGVDYNKMYVGYSGVITFSEPDGSYYAMGPGGSFPNQDTPNNLIASMFGYIYAYTSSFEDAGVYYLLEDDYAIIEWYHYIDGFGMSSDISFQIIVYKNGNIKLQYNYGTSSGQYLSGMSGVGVENADGTDGITISYRQSSIIKDQLAILLTPVRKYVVEPNATSEFDVVLNTEELFAGDYSSELELINNVPNKGDLSVPVNLHVTGSAKLEYNDVIDLGKLMVVKDYDDNTYTEYGQTFEIVNTGVDSVEIFDFNTNKLVSTTVKAYIQSTDWFGNPYWTWVDIASLPSYNWSTGGYNHIYIAPKSSMQFKAICMPEGVATVNDTLYIQNDYADSSDLQIIIMAEAQLPPIINLSSDEINVYTNTADEVKNYTFDFGNNLGGSELNYNLELLIKRNAETSNVSKNVIVSSAANSEIKFKYLDLKTGDKTVLTKSGYNRVLRNDTSSTSQSKVGYGGSLTFCTATRFQAPSDGFNLTHVQTWYVAGDWLNSDIEVEIYAGDSLFQNTSMLYSETFNYTIAEANSTGELLTFELAENQIFYPNEYFFVVFKYPIGVSYPQGMGSVVESLENRFLFGDGSNWYELIGQGFDEYGWMVRAVEKEAQSSLWVELLSTTMGSVAAAESSSLELKFNAANASNGTNYAELNITSNDPYTPSVTVPVYLHKNMAPQFEIENISLSVSENDTLNFNIVANDNEDDNFTLKLVGYPNFASGTINSGDISFVCTPSYDDEGVYTITVEAEDEYGNISDASVLITVYNTNRAPEVINAIQDIGISSSGIQNINLSEVIADPDGDLLTYSVSSSNENVVKVYMADDAVIFTMVSAGTTTITIKGTDSEGLFATHSFNITVWPTDVDDNFAEDIKVYPNPTSGTAYVMLPGEEPEVTIKVLNVLGMIIKEFDASGEETIKINLVNYPSGIYFVNIKSMNMDKSIKVIKN